MSEKKTKQTYNLHTSTMTTHDKDSQQQPHHTQKYGIKKPKNKVVIKNQLQAQQLPTSINHDPHTLMLEQLVAHKQATLNRNSPPPMLHYESTSTWSDEDQDTYRNRIKDH